MSKFSDNNRWRNWRNFALLLAAAAGAVVHFVPEAERPILMAIAVWPAIHGLGPDDREDEDDAEDDD